MFFRADGAFSTVVPGFLVLLLICMHAIMLLNFNFLLNSLIGHDWARGAASLSRRPGSLNSWLIPNLDPCIRARTQPPVSGRRAGQLGQVDAAAQAFSGASDGITADGEATHRRVSARRRVVQGALRRVATCMYSTRVAL